MKITTYTEHQSRGCEIEFNKVWCAFRAFLEYYTEKECLNVQWISINKRFEICMTHIG